MCIRDSGTSGTYVYYDQWENGYFADLANIDIYDATNLDGTQIWGNGNCADGYPNNKNGIWAATAPTCTPAWDMLAAGNVVVLRSVVSDLTGANARMTIDFDGGDRIGATEQIAVSRIFWATGSSTLMAGAVEVYPTDEWGTDFTSPVGINTNSSQMFQYTALTIQAAEPNTTLTVDVNGTASGGITTYTLPVSYTHLTLPTGDLV